MQKEPVAVSTIDVKFSALWTYFEQYPRCRMGSSRLLRMGSRWRNKFQCRSSRKLPRQKKNYFWPRLHAFSVQLLIF